MTLFTAWISADLMHTVAWTLLHFLWEGLALAAFCALLMAMCRTASARYAIALTALALMLAAPVVTFFVLERSPAAAPDFAVSATVAAIWHSSTISTSVPAVAAAPARPLRPDTLLWLVEAWLAGVVFFSLRTAGGLLVIERMRRNQAHAVSARLLEKCLAVQRRMGLGRVIRYCECVRLDAPVVIGWFRPVVLIPVTALTGLSEEQLRAVIAHELAHIRRLDSFANLLQIVAETALFYHPAVWWLNKRIRIERENCCDDAALAVCGDAVEYARALTLMEEWRQAPALAMAANRSPLGARIARLLGVSSARSEIRVTGVVAGVVCLAGALLAANGLMAAGHTSIAAKTPVPFYESTMPLKIAATTNLTASGPQSKSQLSAAALAQHSATAEQSREETGLAESAALSREDGTQAAQSSAQSNQSSASYVDQMKAEGLDNLTADELIALKIQGVTPEYIKEVKALGLHPTVNELIAMRVQGIDPQYIKDMRAIGFNAGINELIGMRVQGVTPEYVRDMRAVGAEGGAREFISMKVQGLTPEYVKEMKAAGVSATPNQLIGMKVQGLTPEYIKEMKAAGVNADANQLIGMKVQGLTADYVKEMKAAGFDASANQLIAMKVQGVTPEYIREMRAAGVNGEANEFIAMRVQGLTVDYVKEMKGAGVNADANQLIGMRVQGLTPDYVKEMKAAGVNASTNQLIGMRVQGVTPEYIKSLQSAGLQNLSANEYIRARVAGITPEFIAAARSHGFKDLTLEKLIELKEANVF